MNEKVSNLEKENRILNNRVSQLYEMVITDREDKSEVKDKVIDLEDRSRRDNLVTDGLADSQGETPQQCETKAKEFIKDALKVQSADKLSIGRCHRVGRFMENQSRTKFRQVLLYRRYK